MGESQGIASVILNNIEGNTGNRNDITSGNIDDVPVMYARNPPVAQNEEEQALIDDRPYLTAMGYSNSVLFDVNNSRNYFSTRVQGALRAIQRGDNTQGSTHWEGTVFLSNPSQWHNRNVNAGSLVRTVEQGATTFFRATGRPLIR